MVFEYSSDGVFLPVGLIVLGLIWAGKQAKKFDKDGAIHATAKDGVMGWLKRWFGK